MNIKSLCLSTTILLSTITLAKEPPMDMQTLLGEYISWAQQTESQGRKVGIPLDARGITLAKEIGIKHPEKVRIIYLDTVPFPIENKALKAMGESLGFIGEGIVNNAQVFGYSIYVRHGFKLNRPKLAHELVHVLQIERANFADVLRQHISDMQKYGYENAPLEAEAFEANIKYAIQE
ncbi:hypothetical protein CKO50_16670 [Pseudoalteromonas sp. HM-SA03]|uniref:hypothetical protein n=1 Tax=Pseudoalteromonas sp. HM-SA03 TaxID=2029678 RepID=UPI000BAE3CB2|nr:hypothetical protein [Pseudoalteromonas sp. HM-SA03]PAY00175.1 hypothetical protein CKO50_16670 [Pseudoalteromonas sp. HM-SA03]